MVLVRPLPTDRERQSSQGLSVKFCCQANAAVEAARLGINQRVGRNLTEVSGGTLCCWARGSSACPRAANASASHRLVIHASPPGWGLRACCTIDDCLPFVRWRPARWADGRIILQTNKRKTMDLIFFLSGIVIVAFVLVTWSNWRERRTEYRTYLDHPTPPRAQAAGDYRHFARVWRKHHRSYLTYCEKTIAAPGSRLSLGAYLRHCELKEAAAAESPSGAAGLTLDSSNRRPSGSKPPGPPPTRTTRT